MNQLQLFPLNMREAAHQYTPSIKDMPASEQPVARLAHAGPAALSTPELLAIVMGARHMADAYHLLTEFQDLNGLARSPISLLQQQPAVGTATAARIKAAFELGRRLLTARVIDKPQVCSPADAAQLLMAEMSMLDQEELRVVLLDTKNRVIDVPTIYKGSLNTCLIRIAETLRPALYANSAAVIMAHNHPSGDPTPSPEDVILTTKMVEA
jgi:DNA repair protein RadC